MSTKKRDERLRVTREPAGYASLTSEIFVSGFSQQKQSADNFPGPRPAILQVHNICIHIHNILCMDSFLGVFCKTDEIRRWPSERWVQKWAERGQVKYTMYFSCFRFGYMPRELPLPFESNRNQRKCGAAILSQKYRKKNTKIMKL